jgi:hypothetical protein
MSKIVALMLSALLVLYSLAIVCSANAQSTSKPSVPEFTLKLVDNSYDEPPIPSTTPTYTIDPYSGKQTILTPRFVCHSWVSCRKQNNRVMD